MSNRRQMYNQRSAFMRSMQNKNSSNVSPEANCTAESVQKAEPACECADVSTPYGADTVEKCDCNNYYVKDNIAGAPLAMAYVPWQAFGNLYDEHAGFHTGTIFKDLDLEFYGRRCK